MKRKEGLSPSNYYHCITIRYLLILPISLAPPSTQSNCLAVLIGYRRPRYGRFVFLNTSLFVCRDEIDEMSHRAAKVPTIDLVEE